MSLFCDVCNYNTNSNYNLKKHFLTNKHIKMLNSYTEKIICKYCNRTYAHLSSYSRHKKLCKTKFEYNQQEYELKVSKLQNENEKKDIEIKKKDIEIKYLKKLNKNKNVNITNNNNINISKIDFLNLNFNNVISIETFSKNYEEKYGLTKEETEMLLYNYRNNSLDTCISNFLYFFRKSAIRQYKDKGFDIAKKDIVLPFILADESLRYHFEKSKDDKWDRTTSRDNIKNLVSITDQQVFKHQNQSLCLSSYEKKRIANGVLKESCFNLLSNLSNPEYYKSNGTEIENETENETENENENETENENESKSVVLTENQNQSEIKTQIKYVFESDEESEEDTKIKTKFNFMDSDFDSDEEYEDE